MADNNPDMLSEPSFPTDAEDFVAEFPSQVACPPSPKTDSAAANLSEQQVEETAFASALAATGLGLLRKAVPPLVGSEPPSKSANEVQYASSVIAAALKSGEAEEETGEGSATEGGEDEEEEEEEEEEEAGNDEGEGRGNDLTPLIDEKLWEGAAAAGWRVRTPVIPASLHMLSPRCRQHHRCP